MPTVTLDSCDPPPIVLCDVFRGTAAQCDAKFRDAWSGGGHGLQVAD